VLYEVKDGAGSSDSGAFAYRKLGQTRDDAAGEAYDKVAKLLGLDIPVDRSWTGWRRLRATRSAG